jgi:hypothetical protein
MASSNIILRRNLLFNNVRCGIQFNGRVADLHIEQNYAYQNGQVANGGGGADFCLEQGVHDSFVRGNVSLGSNFGIALSTYDGKENGGSAGSGYWNTCGSSGTDACICSPINQGGVCAFSEYNIVFANNTLVNTGYDLAGNDISIDPVIEIGRQGGSMCTTATCLATSFYSNTWQNSVVLTKGEATYSPPFTFTTGSASPASGPTNTINGVTYAQTSGGSTGFEGYGLQSGCCGYNPYTCAAAVSGGIIGSAASCINSDPLFVALGAYNNIAGYNLRLQATSPAKATGPALVGNLPMDITGAFLSPTVPSMGAYEYVGGGGGSSGGSFSGGKITRGGGIRRLR